MSKENYIEIELSKLVKADWNYKEDNDDLKEKLKVNITKNGQVENLIVRELGKGKYEIVNGNHRYDAMVELELKTAVAYNLGVIKLEDAKRIAIETNETRFLTNEVKLAAVLKELTGEFTIDDMVSSMPYDEEKLKNYLEMADFKWPDYDDEKPKDDSPPRHKNLHVSEATMSLLDLLKEKIGADPETLDDLYVKAAFSIALSVQEKELKKVWQNITNGDN